LFIKQEYIEEIKRKYKLKKSLLFQQDKSSCHKSRDSIESMEVLFGEDII
jgi:hypothetical protein